MKESMVESLPAQTGSLHENSEVGYYLLLAAEIIESKRPECLFYIFFLIADLTVADVEIFLLHNAKLRNCIEYRHDNCTFIILSVQFYRQYGLFLLNSLIS